MTTREQAAAIAKAARASLEIAADVGMTIGEFLAEHGDRVIGNNAAQVIALADEDAC